MPEANVILVGARDLDLPEAAALSDSAITHIPPGRLDRLDEAVGTLAARVEHFYVHLDVDVLDVSEGRANSYASSGGVSADELYTALELLQGSGRIKVAGITSYDPAGDDDGKIRAIIDKAAAILAGPSGRQ